jgi:hypothetical protein
MELAGRYYDRLSAIRALADSRDGACDRARTGSYKTGEKMQALIDDYKRRAAE